MRSRLVATAALAALLAVPGSVAAQDPSAVPSVAPSGAPSLLASIPPSEAPSEAQSPLPSPVPGTAVDPAATPDPATVSAAGLPAGTVRLMAVGDVMLARTIGTRIKQNGPGIVFGDVQKVLDKADLFVINLECAITTSDDQESKHYTFKAPPVTAEALTLAGVDVAGQANNHVMDWGPSGLLDTLASMKDRGIATPGAGRNKAEAYAPAILERNGLRVAFLAYVDAFTESTGFNTKEWKAGAGTPGVAIATKKRIAADVAAAKAKADVVVVLIHAGYEYVPTHNAEQAGYARAALDAGATLVLGAHPHVLQGYKKVGSKLIAWSLGNFVFDGMDGASVTAILALDLSKDGVANVKWIPVKLVNGFPTLVH